MSQKWRSYLWGEWLSLSKWRPVLSQSLGLVGSRISDRLPRVRRSHIKGMRLSRICSVEPFCSRGLQTFSGQKLWPEHLRSALDKLTLNSSSRRLWRQKGRELKSRGGNNPQWHSSKFQRGKSFKKVYKFRSLLRLEALKVLGWTSHWLLR